MPLSREMRRLEGKWATGAGWPKRLDWVEIDGIRGWTGQRFDLNFPIMAVVGENGAGKSTVLQCAASVYASSGRKERRERFASDFFPDTPWDHVRNASLRYSVREGTTPSIGSIRKPTGRWRGNPERRKRPVEYIDLSRIQPVPARVGYTKLANPMLKEAGGSAFEDSRLSRFSEIMGRTYDLARMATTDVDQDRRVPVISQLGATYSGFHQGAGETTIAELLQADLPRHALVLIDEVESSLHPRAQRRLIRDLAQRCREGELQVILTTHSPYVLEELPLVARAYILQTPSGRREIMYGVSPDFAMSRMDDVPHHECDVYVEDERAARMFIEVLAEHAPDLVQRCQVIPCGAASVGKALGIMVEQGRFPRPSCVFLDGDRGEAPGCSVLPGEDAPERVVFEALKDRKWVNLEARLGRSYSAVADACEKALTLTDHHDWVRQAAAQLVLGSDTLWQAMCAEWAAAYLAKDQALDMAQKIGDLLLGIETPSPRAPLSRSPSKKLVSAAPQQTEPTTGEKSPPTNEPMRLFGR